ARLRGSHGRSGGSLDRKGGRVLLKVRHRSRANLYSCSRSYSGADRGRNSTGSSHRGVNFRGYFGRGGRENHSQRAGPAIRLDLRPPGNQDTGGPQREKTWDIEIRRGERNRCGDV